MDHPFSDQPPAPALPPRAILGASLVLGLVSIAGLKTLNSNSPLVGLSLGLLVVSLLPWLVVLRRRAWRKRYPEGGRWMTAVTALLWIALLLGPLVTGAFWASTSLSPAPDGMANLSRFLGVVAFAVISFSAAYWLAVVAFVIQLWRDQWRVKLTAVTIAYLFVIFVVCLHSMS